MTKSELRRQRRLATAETMRRMRFEKCMTLQQIGDAHGGLSRERVRQLIGNTGYIRDIRRGQNETDDSRARASLL